MNLGVIPCETESYMGPKALAIAETAGTRYEPALGFANKDEPHETRFQ